MKNKRGVSFLELMVVLAIFGILLLIVIANWRQPAGSASSSSLAQVLASELRAARLRAQNNGMPVAVVIPSGAGTRPHSQSFYILEGWTHPTVSSVRTLAGDFPSAYLFVGAWPLSGDSVALAPALPLPFSISNWLSGPSSSLPTQDYVIGFTPDGSVFTNDLPWFSSADRTELRVVACAGLTYSPGSAPSGTSVAGTSKPNYFTLTSVNQPQTVCISPNGVVTVEALLKGDDATSCPIQPGTSEPAYPGAGAPSLTQGSGANVRPVICEIDYYPQAGNNTLGYTTKINSTGYVTMVIKATDANAGDLLACNVTATNTLTGGASGQGQWSQAPGGRMHFDPNDTLDATSNSTHPNNNALALYPHGCWKSTWVWTPPSPGNSTYAAQNGAAGGAGVPVPGVSFNLVATVTDQFGASATSDGTGTGAGAAGSVDVVNLLVSDQGHVIFSGQFADATTGAVNWRLWSLSPEGTNPQAISSLTAPFDSIDPSVSPDGTKILYVANTTNGSTASGSLFNVWVCNNDGSNPTLILQDTSNSLRSPAWAPTGSSFVYCNATTPTTGNIQLCQSFSQPSPGTNPTVTTVAPGTQPRWSPSVNVNQPIVFVDNTDSKVQTLPMNGPPFVAPQVICTAVNVVGPTWDSLGTSIIYSSYSTSGTLVNVIASPLTTPTQTQIDAGAGTWIDSVDGPLTFSPDNSHAAYGHAFNTPAYGVFVDYSGVLLNSVPFGISPFGPGNVSIMNVSYPSWSVK